MATTDYAMTTLDGNFGTSVNGALSTIIDGVYRQFPRAAPLLNILPIKEYDGGKAINFDIVSAHSGTLCGPGNEMDDMVPATDGEADKKIMGTLKWTIQKGYVQASGLAIDAAKQNSPSELGDLLASDLQGKILEFAQQVDKQILNGRGTDVSPAAIQGMWYSDTSGAIAVSGSYAGLSRETYPVLRGNPTAQPVTGSAVTAYTIETYLTDIEVRSLKRPDLIMVSPRLYAKLKNELFNSANVRRVTIDGTPLNTAGENFMFGDIPVVKNINISESDGYGKMFLLNTSTLYIAILKQTIDPQSESEIPLYCDSPLVGVSELPIKIKIKRLAELGDYKRYQLIAKMQLVCTQPNANAYIGNLSLTSS